MKTLFLALAGSVAVAQSSSTVNGSKNQSTGTNNGNMWQFNVTVKPQTERNLKSRSSQDFGTDRGWLQTIVPANDVISDDLSCPVPHDNLTVLLGEHGNKGSCSGDHCAILIDKGPRAVNREILSVDRKAQSMQVNVVVFDESGKIVAVVNKSRTHVNPNTAFDWQRPDDHTINVVDNYNRNVLHVRFANPHTVIVEGIFHFSDGRNISVTKDRVVDQFENEQSGDCSTNAGALFAF